MKIIELPGYRNYDYDRKKLEKLTYELYSVLPPTVSYLAAEDGKAVLINAGSPAEQVCEVLDREHLALTDILLTSALFEHTFFLAETVWATGARVYLHPADQKLAAALREEAVGQLSIRLPEPYSGEFLSAEDGEQLELNGMTFLVHAAPGVTPGSVYYEVGDSLFTGDLIAHQAVGTCDLSVSISTDLLRALKALRELDRDYRIYPSHWGKTTLEHEKATNLKKLPLARIIRTVDLS